MRQEHERAIAEAAAKYIAATEAQKVASAKLADAMRAAYSDNERQSAILRAAGHVWSREYLRVLLGLTKKAASSKSGEDEASGDEI
jgi:hypothetical protein